MEKTVKVKILGALANQNRLDILTCLCDGQKNVTQIIKSTGLSQSAVSHSLNRLSSSGLISSTPQNRYRYYAISAPIIPSIIDILEKHTSRIG